MKSLARLRSFCVNIRLGQIHWQIQCFSDFLKFCGILRSLLYSSGLFLIILCISVIISNMHAVVLCFALFPLHPLSCPKTDITHVLSARRALVNVLILSNSHLASACIYTSAKKTILSCEFQTLDGHLSWKDTRLVCSIDGSQWSFLFE